tara:strand:+ start:236 stop:448 length:213 start_codon:yes stop_codon:yes gene_type:complete
MSQTRPQPEIIASIDPDMGTLTVTIPIDDPPRPSASGKTLVLASTRGNLNTGVQIQGKDIIVGLNAYLKR